MNNRKRYISILLSMVLLANMVPVSVLAAEENTPKEEVIYTNLRTDGSMKETSVVNIFELEEKGEIIDYGAYETVRNMNSTDEIKTSDDQIRISSGAGRIYYEGAMDSAEIPWKIEVHYYMDGKELESSELAGKSGSLKVTMIIEENKACERNFFDSYALQATVILDSALCTEIEAEGATIANVGADKQLTYTILPGEGADITITADVTAFEMPAITINGISLNLDIDVDTEEIESQIDEVIDAVNTLDEGAGEVNDGASELSDATGVLAANVAKLYEGTGKLKSGTAELSSGLTSITKNNQTLLNGGWTAFEGLCTAAETTLNAELTANGMETVTLTPKNYENVLKGLLKKMDADAVYEQAYAKALEQITKEVEAQTEALEDLPEEQIAEIRNGYIEQMMKSEEVTSQISAAVAAVSEAAEGVADLKGQLDNYSMFYDGLRSYTSAVSESANGAKELKINMNTLYQNTGILDASVGKLDSAVKELFGGTTKLKEGTDEFVDEASDMSGKVDEEIDTMLESITREDTERSSFVSEKNVNVKSVQFVIKTEAIEIEEAEEVMEEETEKLSFWQKLLNLFGL